MMSQSERVWMFLLMSKAGPSTTVLLLGIIKRIHFPSVCILYIFIFLPQVLQVKKEVEMQNKFTS